MAVADDDEIAARADVLYEADAVLDENWVRSPGFGVAEIVQFLLGTRPSLSVQEQRLLFQNPRLRAAYQRLKAQRSVYDVPMLAAASTEEVSLRQFDGGEIRIHPSRLADQTYVIVRFEAAGKRPSALLIETSDGVLLRRDLPQDAAGSEMILILDAHDADDALFLGLLRDSAATGTFLFHPDAVASRGVESNPSEENE